MNGSIPFEECERKPTTIVVSLIDKDQEYDRVSLDMVRDFGRKLGSEDYALRSEIFLHGPEAPQR